MASNGSRSGTRGTGSRRARFDTTGVRLRRTRNGDRPSEDGAPPAVASARAYLRSGLPAVYQEEDFGLRFVGALETVLDPIVGVLDSLPAHFRPELAPADVLELLAGWLGLELDESWPDERRRQLVRRAAELARRRGTRGGMELALGLAFPHLPLRVQDGGRVSSARSEAELPEESGPPSFVVYCDSPLDPPEQAAVARVIEDAKPVHVTYRLRVKARKAGGAAPS